MDPGREAMESARRANEAGLRGIENARRAGEDARRAGEAARQAGEFARHAGKFSLEGVEAGARREGRGHSGQSQHGLLASMLLFPFRLIASLLRLGILIVVIGIFVLVAYILINGGMSF